MENNNKSWIAILLVIIIAAGLAIAGGQNGFEVNRFSLFAIAVAIAFIIQWIVFIPAYFLKTEKFFDLTGSITFITVTAVAVFLSEKVDARSYLLFGMVAIWALRLGIFLFGRIKAAGEDRRFREIKKYFSRFL